MPFKNAEDGKKWRANYYLENKEIIKTRSKNWRRNHIEEVKENKQRWRKKNRSHVNEYEKTRRRQIRKEVLEYYGGIPPRCACCGEQIEQFLTVDHIDGSKKKDKLGGVPFYFYLKRMGFPEELQILCYNCNNAKGKYGICPHQLILKQSTPLNYNPNPSSSQFRDDLEKLEQELDNIKESNGNMAISIKIVAIKDLIGRAEKILKDNRDRSIEIQDFKRKCGDVISELDKDFGKPLNPSKGVIKHGV